MVAVKQEVENLKYPENPHHDEELSIQRLKKDRDVTDYLHRLQLQRRAECLGNSPAVL